MIKGYWPDNHFYTFRENVYFRSKRKGGGGKEKKSYPCKRPWRPIGL
jgi:hypothetical protein